MSTTPADAQVIDTLGSISSARSRSMARNAIVIDVLDGAFSDRIRSFRRDAEAFFSGGGVTPPTTITYYRLGAVDGSGRRYWVSTTLNFADAPPPVGSWDTGTLTVLSSWQV